MVVISRGWLSVSEAGRYVGINPDVIRRAIASGELRAYEKPVTHRSEGIHRFLKVSRAEIDRWIEECWAEA